MEDTVEKEHHKECPICEGEGHEQAHEGAVKEICKRCKGTGTVDMTQEEIDFENSCKKDDEYENRE